MKRQPTCHPDRPYEGRGLCESCYHKARYAGTLIDHERTRRRRDDFLDDYRTLRARGLSRVQIAQQLGVTRDAVDKAIKRARLAGVQVPA